MTSTRNANIGKLWEIVSTPEERWRLSLLWNKQVLKRKQSDAEGEPGSDVELDALRKTAKQWPQALQLAVRKHWRSNNLEAGLALVDEIWKDVGERSGEFAFACAVVWYQYGKAKKGDVALAAAKRLLPEEIRVWAMEAETQAKRGNAHAAINAAENALTLASTSSQKTQWQLFLGEQYYRLDRYEKVIEHVAPVLENSTGWRRHYEYAVALQALGDYESARREYLACAKKAVPQAKPGFEVAELHFKAERHRAMRDELQGLKSSRERSRLLARSYLALGEFQECVGLGLGSARTPQLAEYAALALELSGQLTEALNVYADLSVAPVSPKRRGRILRRYARVAHQVGDYQQSVHAETLFSNNVDILNGLDAEVDPDFAATVRAANTAMAGGNLSRAISELRSLEMSASSGKNISRVNRVLGLLLAREGDFLGASAAFFKSNPFPMPNAGEANSNASALQGTERYSETISTVGINENVILYESFYGAKTSCNPLAICLALLNDPQAAHLQHVWVLKDNAPIHDGLRGRTNVHFVRYMSTGYMMHIATAGKLVNNSTFPRWFTRREEQRYVNTWHGIPWKHMGIDVEGDAFTFENVARNFLQCSDLFLPNKFTAETLLRTQNVQGIVGRKPRIIGSPRVDRMLNQTVEDKQGILERIGLSGQRPVVFYAPTWRGRMDERQSNGQDILAVIRTIAAHDVDVIVRAHYFAGGSLSGSKLPGNVWIPHESIDTNELLGVTDVLVSDYSSLIFDFAALARPIIKHVYDLEKYTFERGLYFDVNDVPGAVSNDLAQLNDQLRKCLEADPESFGWEDKATAYLWAGEDGHATERAIYELFRELEPVSGTRAPLVISMNSLNPNGITRSFGNLVETTAARVGHIQAILPSHFFAGADHTASANALGAQACYTLRSSFHTGTRQERIVWAKLSPLREPFPQDLLPWIRSRMRREFRRTFGGLQFRAAVDFDGHDLYAAALMAYGPDENTERIYVGHNEFCAEMEMRFPNHRGIGTLLAGYSRIAAVSPAVMEANRDGLAQRFEIGPELHTVLPNTLNIDEIVTSATAPLETDLKSWFERPGTHLIMIGRLSPEKNHKMAFEALGRSRTIGHDVDLLILGDGPLRSDLERYVEDLGLAESVYFAGQRANPYSALGQSSGLLLSSKHEGQPMVFLEAMTLGVPIAATRIPASISTLRNGKDGLLVEVTPEGIQSAIDSLAAGKVARAEFDSRQYLKSAVQDFLLLIGADEGPILNSTVQADHLL